MESNVSYINMEDLPQDIKKDVFHNDMKKIENILLTQISKDQKQAAILSYSDNGITINWTNGSGPKLIEMVLNIVSTIIDSDFSSENKNAVCDIIIAHITKLKSEKKIKGE